MHKPSLQKPLLVLLYGYPGVGKTYFARQLADFLGMAHLQADRIRHELFEKPQMDKRENQIVSHLMNYMSEEFMKAGVSVIYDDHAIRTGRRRAMRDLARRLKANHALIWLQSDRASAFSRASGRSRRKTDDRYALRYDQDRFDQLVRQMQNPTNEDYFVISGKHTFATQKNAVIKRFYELGLIDADTAQSRLVKPELVNLVPPLNRGRVDNRRRNIFIR